MKNLKLVIALPLEEKLLTPLYSWGKRFDWQDVDEVHFLHIVKKNIAPLEFGLMEMPDEKTYQEMIPTLDKFLKDESKKIVSPDFNGKMNFRLELDSNPEEEIIFILKEVKPDFVIVSTHGKHGFEGLFHSSFTDHMVRFAPCDVIVVRPR